MKMKSKIEVVKSEDIKDSEAGVKVRYFEYSDIEAVINKYFESKGNKTPMLVELSDIKNYIKENI